MDNDVADPLNRLFRGHYGRLTRVIGRVIHDQARAEEIAVDVFLKWKQNPKAHGDGAEGWMYRVAIRMALDELRRVKRRQRFEQIVSTLQGKPHTPAELHSASVEQQNVRAVLGALRTQHTTLLLLWSEGLAYREIADVAGIQPNYVGSLLSRAQEAFRKEYQKRYGKVFPSND